MRCIINRKKQILSNGKADPWIGLVLILICVCYTCWYLSFSDPLKSYGALSVIGLEHPVLFLLWGALAEITLYFNIQTAYRRAAYRNKYARLLLNLGIFSVVITVFVPFDYHNIPLYITHCYGAISFIVYNGVAMLILFFRFYRKRHYCILGIICTVVLLTTLLLFLWIGESGVLEVTPMLLSFSILLLVNFSKKFKAVPQPVKKKDPAYFT